MMLQAGGVLEGFVCMNVGILVPATKLTLTMIGIEDIDYVNTRASNAEMANMAEIVNMSFNIAMWDPE